MANPYETGLLDQILVTRSGFLLEKLEEGWFEPAAVAPSTQVARIRRVKTFERWARDHGFIALPAEPKTVVLYATTNSLADKSWGTIKEDLNAIDWHHERNGYPKPGKSPEVAEWRKGASRAVSRPPKKAYPLSVEEVAAMNEAIRAGAIDFKQAKDERNELRRLRASALLLVQYASGARVSDLLTAKASWLTVGNNGWVALDIPRSKNHADGVSYRIYPSAEPELCPVLALTRWLDCAHDSGGLPDDILFPQVRSVGSVPLINPLLGHSGVALARKVEALTSGEGHILKVAATTGGVKWNPERHVLATRSTRRGLATEAHQAGAAIRNIKRTLGHVLVRTTSRYVETLSETAAKKVLA